VSDERWLSDWLLGEGTDEERRQMERRLASDPQLRARARRLEAVTGRLRDLPPAAWEAIVEQDTVAGPAARRFALPRPALAGLAAAALFATGLGVGALLNGSSSSPSRPPSVARRVALRPLTGAPGRAAGVAYVTSADQLRLDVTDLPATDSRHYYEAWLISSARRLVPLASFRVDHDGGARLQLQLPAGAASYRYIDVSLQRVGAGTALSHRSVLRGLTASGRP
jgi:hypothetical protein